MVEISRSGRTHNVMFAQIYRAARINKRLNGVLVAPWDVDEIDINWLDAFDALDFDLAKMSQADAQIEKRKEEILRDSRR